MKLNHDCVRDVLLFVEEEQRPGIFLHLNDFISIQDPKIWKTTKAVASHLESVSITLISNIASSVLENYIQRFIPKP